MEVQLIYKENSFLFTISPLMPISYLRNLSQKSFNIPEYLINLTYQNNIIEKQYNETSLKEYFKTSHRVIIKVTEIEPKNTIKNLLTSTVASTTIKSSKISKLIQEDKKFIKKNFDFHKLENNNEDENLKRDKCQLCKKRDIDYFCRDDCKFLCKICKNSQHNNHRVLLLEKGNIEQCIYIYKKELIKEIQLQEKDIKDLIEKSGLERINEKIEEVYDILAKIGDLERDIMENFPCLPIESISDNDYTDIRKNIYAIKIKFQKKNPYLFDDKIPFFKELQNEDFNLDNMRKDIESIKRKFDFQDMLYDVLEQMRDNFSFLHQTLNEIWTGNKTNILAFSHEMGNYIKMIKKKFNYDKNKNDEEEEDEESIDSELDELFLENKKNNNLTNLVLPRLLYNKKNNKKKNIDNEFPIFNTLNLDRRKKIFSMDNKNKNDSSYDSDNKSYHSNSTKKNLKQNFAKKNSLTERARKRYEKKVTYKDSNGKEDIKLDQVLLTGEEDKGPKRPPKRNSIRMSIFIKNMNKVDSISTSKIMKVKKKKKKYM